MVLDDIARVVCQTDRKYPLYLRAITLFGFQVAILSPADPARESKARVLAALKILESLEIAVGSDADLENRLELPDYRDVLNLLMREGGAKALRLAGTTREFWGDIDARLGEVKDVAGMVEFSHRFAEFRPPSSAAAKLAGSTMARVFCTQTGGSSDGYAPPITTRSIVFCSNIDLVSCSMLPFGQFDEEVVQFIARWSETADFSAFKLIANLLQEAPHQFVFTHKDFVLILMARAQRAGSDALKQVGSALLSASVGGLRQGTPGEPVLSRSGDQAKKRRNHDKLVEVLARLRAVRRPTEVR